MEATKGIISAWSQSDDFKTPERALELTDQLVKILNTIRGNLYILNYHDIFLDGPYHGCSFLCKYAISASNNNTDEIRLLSSFIN